MNDGERGRGSVSAPNQLSPKLLITSHGMVVLAGYLLVASQIVRVCLAGTLSDLVKVCFCGLRAFRFPGWNTRFRWQRPSAFKWTQRT